MNKKQSESVMLKVMTSKVTINLNMLDIFIKDGVVSNLNSTFLSRYIEAGQERETHESTSNQRNQTISLVVDVIAQYLAYVKDQETIVYFLHFQ